MTERPRRIANGPNILCRICGTISNHVTGLCAAHRDQYGGNVRPTRADQAYLEWKRLQDQEHKP